MYISPLLPILLVARLLPGIPQPRPAPARASGGVEPVLARPARAGALLALPPLPEAPLPVRVMLQELYGQAAGFEVVRAPCRILLRMGLRDVGPEVPALPVAVRLVRPVSVPAVHAPVEPLALTRPRRGLPSEYICRKRGQISAAAGHRVYYNWLDLSKLTKKILQKELERRMAQARVRLHQLHAPGDSGQAGFTRGVSAYLGRAPAPASPGSTQAAQEY